jgi:hypothetical protein
MWSKIGIQTAGSFRGFANARFRSRRSGETLAYCFDTSSNVLRPSFSTLSVPANSGRDGQPSGMIVRHSTGCACCENRIHRGHRRHFSSTNEEGIDKAVVVDDDDDSPKAASSDEIKIPGAEKGGRKLAIIFTCTHCETRSAKQFTENSYKNGVVIATCPGCNKKHLIADNLGFFPDECDKTGWNIEKAMEKLGEKVKVATNGDVWELSLEDIYTKEAIDNAVKNATDAAAKPGPDTQ